MESVDVDGFFEIKNRIRDLDLSALENRLDLRSVKAKHVTNQTISRVTQLCFFVYE
jgi:hypothetical protein